jgi:hypothetical protein
VVHAAISGDRLVPDPGSGAAGLAGRRIRSDLLVFTKPVKP